MIPKHNRIRLEVYVTIDSESDYPSIRSKTSIKKVVDQLLKANMPEESHPTVRSAVDLTEEWAQNHPKTTGSDSQ